MSNDKAPCIALGLACLVPIVGVICWELGVASGKSVAYDQAVDTGVGVYYKMNGRKAFTYLQPSDIAERLRLEAKGIYSEGLGLGRYYRSKDQSLTQLERGIGPLIPFPPEVETEAEKEEWVR